MDRSLADIEDRTAEHVEAYRDSAPFYPVEEEAIGSLSDAFRAGEYGKRDVEWVVRWYFRRRVGDVDHGGAVARSRRQSPTRTDGNFGVGSGTRSTRWTGPTARPAPATAQATVRSIVIARARETVRAKGDGARARVTVRRPPITGPSTRSRNCRASTLPSPPRCSGSSIRTGTWSSATGWWRVVAALADDERGVDLDDDDPSR